MITDPDDYLLRPIHAGMCRYESALDGSLNLIDFARMNDYLDRMVHNAGVNHG